MTSGFLHRQGLNIVFAIVGVALLTIVFLMGRSCAGDVEPVLVTVTDTVEREVILEGEPPPAAEIRWRDRLVYRSSPPETVLVSVGPPEPEVSTFCAPAVAEAVAAAVGDTTVPEPPEPSVLIRSFSVQPGWFFGKDRLVITAPVSTGGLIQQIDHLHPGYTARVAETGAAIDVRESRWWWVREGFEFLTYAGIGAGLGIGYCKAGF